jgi:hypothetical protein
MSAPPKRKKRTNHRVTEGTERAQREDRREKRRKGK